ncbi:MAG TPA: hypothetical protein VK689_01370 [Armatimonadota bacterium]|nr:hypothetical protein [Armatimonadota bacterium]
MTRFNRLSLAAGMLTATLAAPGWADDPPAAEPPAPPKQADSKPAEAPRGGTSPSAPPAPAPPMPAPQPPVTSAQDPRDREIEELKRVIEDLRKRVEGLEKRPTPDPAAPTPDPAVPVPDPAAPAPDDPVTPVPSPFPTGPPRASATLLPNISVIGNLIARGGDTRAVPGRGRSHFEELEIAFQDAVAPKLRYDVFLAAEKEEDWTVALEEGFLTATAILPRLNARAGRIRTPVGKFNPLHPHQWVTITQPFVHTALVGDHGLISDGAILEWLLPTKRFYGSLQFGASQNTTAEHHHEHEEEGKEPKGKGKGGGEVEPHPYEEGGFRGGDNGAYHTRLALGKELGRNNEFELGLNRYWGRGEVEGFGRRMLALNALDLTFRRYPGGNRRLFLQTELLAHQTSDIRGGTKSRAGMFALAAYRWNRFWEAGVRGDYTKFPFPVEGKAYGASLFLTRYLTEQTSLRVEYQHAKDPRFGSGNGIFFQVLFGSGPHAHNLQ